jgi:ABC-type lipoprotein export system ATPase subunit
MVGDRGAGVSSLLKFLAGVMPPRQGAYRLDQDHLHALSPMQRSRYQLSIGSAMGHGGLLSNFTLRGNLLLPLQYHRLVSERDAAKRAAELLERFEISRFADILPAIAPATARKACALARAFIMDPCVLVLDEPTESLHAKEIGTLISLVQEHEKSKALRFVFVSTEEASFLKAFPFECVRLKERKLERVRQDKQVHHASA